MAQLEVKVPDIGDFKDVSVIELLVKPGDTVAAEQSLLTLESDKASMEIPSPQAGVVKELRVALGDKINEGSVIAMLETADQAAAPAAQAAAPADAPAPAKPPSAPAPTAAPATETAARAPAAGASDAATAAGPAPAGGHQGGAAAPAPAAGGAVEVAVPDIGDFAEVAVIEVFVKPGDTVRVEQSLITVESDKASMEIPSSHAGVVEQVHVKLGDKVAQGSAIVTLQRAAGAAAPAGQEPGAARPTPAAAQDAPSPSPPPAAGSKAEAPAAPPAAAAPPPDVGTAAVPPHAPGQAAGRLPHASPSIRRMARELGVPLGELRGSGPNGRITQADLQAFVKGVMGGSVQTAAQKAGAPAAAAGAGGIPGLLPWPQVDFARYGPVERKPLSRIRKISGANLHRNWVLIPHVTNNDEADITELEAFRLQLNKENEKSGVKVTMLGFVVKAVVAALQKFPEFNASLDGDALVYKQYVHIGFAADTPNGLVVPVLKDADRKGLLQISQEMSELAKKARDGKLSPADMAGGCFSISSLGGIGGTHFTPIINAPEVAILGLSRSAMKPQWDGHAFQPRLMLPLSLSYDHRVIDGAAAARFNAHLAQLLADFRRVLL